MFDMAIHFDKESLVFGSAIPFVKSKELRAGDKKPTLYCIRTLSYIYLLLGAKFSLVLQIILEVRFCLPYIIFIGFNLRVKNRLYASVRLTKMFQI